MRSALGKECRKLFRKMMTTEFPEYHEDKGQIVPSGKHIWTREHPSGVWLHIIFMIHPTNDEFTLEAAWDLDGKLPPVSYNGAHGIFEHPIWFRANFIWNGKDYWWPLVLRPEEFERTILYQDDPIEDCLPLVAPAVWDAAKKLKEHLVPAFDKIIQKSEKSDRRQ